MIGQTLFQYQILEKLGEGGMGVVYKARDTRLNRFVAIKSLPAGHFHNPERRRRFLQEAQALSALNHPNIVTVYDLVEDNGADYLVMEFVPGKTLDRVAGRKGLGIQEVLRYAVQMADGLAASHKAGIVHRDLKPGNVLVTESGQIKLVDFGLAKNVTEESVPAENEATRTERAVTEKGVVMGTASYMSPEQAQGKNVDARTDIFSLGAVMHEMLTGRRTFQGDNLASIMSSVLRDEPKPIEESAPDAPKDLVRAVNRCLRKDPDKRWQHMADLKVALEEMKAETESGAIPAAVVRPSSRRWIWAAGIMVPILAGGGWLAMRTRVEAPRSAELQPVQLTSEPGAETSPSFSPDGTQIAYAQAKQDGNKVTSNVMVRVVGEATAVQLTKDGDSSSPAWSPDGRLIAFVGRRGSSTGIYTIPPIGGSERKVAEINGAYPSWSPDSQWIAASRFERATNESAVVLIHVGTGEQRVLHTVTERRLAYPKISPDGAWISFIVLTWSTGEQHLLPLTSDYKPAGSPTRLARGDQINECTWPNDSSSLICVGRTSASDSPLLRVPLDGSPVSTIFAGRAGEPAVSRTGNRLAFSMSPIWDTDIVEFDLEGPKDADSVPRIVSTMREYSPQYSPDGSRIAFTSDRQGKTGVWVCGKDGTNPQMLDGYNVTTGSPAWSPDGRWISYDTRATGAGDIYVVSSDGGGRRRLTASDANEATSNWSRDGKSIYYRSAQTGRNEVWRVPAEGGIATQFTRNGGATSFESLDGKTLYYLKTSDFVTELWAKPTAGGEEKLVLPAIYARAFQPASSGVYFVDGPDANQKVRLSLWNPATGAVRALREMSAAKIDLGLAISPDGRKALFTNEKSSLEADLMLVENFR